MMRRRRYHKRPTTTPFRSKLEERVALALKGAGVDYTYESQNLKFTRLCTYTPDFILSNGLIIEVKGRFTSDDRRKHVAIKKQHPDLDIRFVFENSRRKLSKGAKSTYATWCERNKFLYADRVIPEEWLKQKGVDVHPDLVVFPYDKIKRS